MIEDITYCHGELDTDFQVFVCPKRDQCKRYWTEEKKKEAAEKGIFLCSFFCFNSVSDFKSCEHFWKDK